MRSNILNNDMEVSIHMDTKDCYDYIIEIYEYHENREVSIEAFLDSSDIIDYETERNDEDGYFRFYVFGKMSQRQALKFLSLFSNIQLKYYDRNRYEMYEDKERVELLSDYKYPDFTEELIKRRNGNFLDMTGFDFRGVKSFIFEEHMDQRLLHEITSINMTGVDTSGLQKLSFQDMSSLTYIHGLGDLDVSNIINMDLMFYKCRKLEQVDLDKWDIRKVITMHAMFFECNKIFEINGLDKWNTKSLKQVTSMFTQCNNLKTLDISGWNLKNVRELNYMFGNCISLETINMTNVDLSRVTDMYSMFHGCCSLKKITGHEKWDVSNVKSMIEMFYSCEELVKLDISKWNTESLRQTTSMFLGCRSLVSIGDTSKLNLNNLFDLSCMFYECTKL